jgi:psp operon transcriptional activator
LTDVRLIAATNVDLPELARQGRFREDLLDRLAFDVITLPPLRARREDILLLAERFAMGMSQELGHAYFAGFTEAARERLLRHDWPGNVRELKNAVERSVYRANAPSEMIDDIVLDPFDSPYRPGHAESIQQPSPPPPPPVGAESIPAPGPLQWPVDFHQVIRQQEVDLIRAALRACRYNQRKTAEMLGVTYHQLRGYLKKYDLLSAMDPDTG